MTTDIDLRGEAFLNSLRRVVVAGFGRSGRAAAAVLTRHGVETTVVDVRDRAEIADELAPLPGTARFVPQDRAGDALNEADLVVLSPGIDPRCPPYADLAAAGVSVISEIELGSRLTEAPLVAVTGSNGKSTVTSLIGQLLEAAGRDARVCGNIGRPLCAALENQKKSTTFVVEVSSFQLERTTTFAPDVAVLLNVTPDHQDRYDDFGSYVAAKENLFTHQGTGAVAVLCGDDPAAAEMAHRLLVRHGRDDGPAVLIYGAAAPGHGLFDDLHTDRQAGIAAGALVVRLGDDEHVLGRVDDLPLVGPHNVLNVLAASATALSLGVDARDVSTAIATLTPLPHRLELVGERDGVRFVNDSKATNIASAVVALRAFAPGTVHAILGGRDKGADFEILADDLERRARAVYAIGEAGPRIAAGLAAAGLEIPTRVLPDLGAAVEAAAAAARDGDVVLLSPACASFDAYDSFEERGEHFRALARLHLEEA